MTQGAFMSSPDNSKPQNPSSNIEISPNPNPPEPSGAALRLRIRQQEILAELGVLALQRTQLQDLLNSAVRMAAEGLQAELCKVLEYLASDNRLLLRAGL